MRILLVEDDDRIARPLAEDLSHQNHIVDLAHDGLEGWQYAQAIDYELILLDLMLPKLDGVTLCKQLRTSGSKALILMLTSRDTTSDKVVGLDAGADDYLVKPFELEELAARIRALARRSPETKPLILTHGALQLDPSSTQGDTRWRKPLPHAQRVHAFRMLFKEPDADSDAYLPPRAIVGL